MNLPDCLYQIVEQAINNIDWNDMGCEPANVFHYRYEATNPYSWTVTIHPAVHEVVGGGKNDGAIIFPKFNLSISEILKKFDQVFDIIITTREKKLCIDGKVGKYLFSLEIMTKPPKRLKPLKSYNFYTKKSVKK